jgi:hypothetical protein
MPPLARGDRIVEPGRGPGRPGRVGVVRRVVGGRAHPRYEVEWEHGGVSVVYPGAVEAAPPRARRRARRPRVQAPAVTPAQPERPTAEVGERLVVRAHHQGEPERDAEILEVLGPDGTPPFRVRWSDTGAESIFFPGSDAFVEHARDS